MRDLYYGQVEPPSFGTVPARIHENAARLR